MQLGVGFCALASSGAASGPLGGFLPDASAQPSFKKLPSDPATLHQAFHYADIAAPWRWVGAQATVARALPRRRVTLLDWWGLRFCSVLQWAAKDKVFATIPRIVKLGSDACPLVKGACKGQHIIRIHVEECKPSSTSHTCCVVGRLTAGVPSFGRQVQ